MLLTMKYHPLVVFIEQEVCIQMIADKHTTSLLIMLDNPGHGTEMAGISVNVSSTSSDESTKKQDRTAQYV